MAHDLGSGYTHLVINLSMVPNYFIIIILLFYSQTRIWKEPKSL